MAEGPQASIQTVQQTINRKGWDMTPMVRRAADYGVRFSNGGSLEGPYAQKLRAGLFGHCKKYPFVIARHAAWAYLRSIKREDGTPRFSFPTIARITRPNCPPDHTSIIYGVEKHRERFPGDYARLFPETAQFEMFEDAA